MLFHRQAVHPHGMKLISWCTSPRLFFVAIVHPHGACACTCVSIYICIYVYMYIYVYICIYIHDVILTKHTTEWALKKDAWLHQVYACVAYHVTVSRMAWHSLKIVYHNYDIEVLDVTVRNCTYIHKLLHIDHSHKQRLCRRKERRRTCHWVAPLRFRNVVHATRDHRHRLCKSLSTCGISHWMYITVAWIHYRMRITEATAHITTYIHDSIVMLCPSMYIWKYVHANAQKMRLASYNYEKLRALERWFWFL